MFPSTGGQASEARRGHGRREPQRRPPEVQPTLSRRSIPPGSVVPRQDAPAEALVGEVAPNRLAQGEAGAVQPGFHGGNGQTEHLRRILRRQLLHVAQEEDRP